MVKKLIIFDEEIDQILNLYCKKYKTTYTKAVRSLVMKGNQDTNQEFDINPTEGSKEPNRELERTIRDMKQKLDALGFYRVDEMESNIGNLTLQVKELVKKVDVLTKVSKVLANHLKDKKVHIE